MKSNEQPRLLEYGTAPTTTRVVLSCVAILLTVLLLASGAAGAQSAPSCGSVSYDGGGTSADPYKVDSIDRLQCINANHANATSRSDALSSDYKLMSDIDASGTASWNGGNGFDPISEDGNKFTGTFNGSGNAVGDLYIDRSREEYVGLFGFTGSSTVKDVGVEDADVTGKNLIGGLVGRNEGTVSGSYVTGNVSGSNEVGGLVGESIGTVASSYATAEVSGSGNFVGGLVGVITFGAKIERSYATGGVSGNSDVGGLVGFDTGTVTDSYWDVNTTGQTTSAGSATGLTTEEMKGSPAESNMSGFDFTTTWDVVDTRANGNEVSYPFLQSNAQQPEPGLESLYAGGDGSASNPYQIANWTHLNNTRQNLGANFTVVNELNSSTAGYDEVASPTANGDKGFKPVGGAIESGTPFSGGFDGDGHTIKDLNINRTSGSNIGLFRQVESGYVEKVGLENVTITGQRNVGGITSSNRGGRINESYVTGNVTGVGGVIRIPMGTNTGALVGINTLNGLINNSYATANVTAPDTVGGLVARNVGSSTIKNSYATGVVSGNSNVGGLIGSKSSATATDSYWDVNTTNQTSSAGGTGLRTEQLKANTSLSGFDFTNVWDVVDTNGDVSYPYLRNNTQTPAPGLERLYAGGDGSVGNPYRIADWTHLNNTRQNLGANFTLVNDLNSSTAGYSSVASSSANGGDGFAPVGTISAPFTGGFEGDGHSIVGFRINRTSPTNVGLFGRVGSTGTVANLSVADANVSIVETDNSVFPNTGLVAGNSDGTVRNVSVVGNVTSTYSNLGGVAGINNGTVTLSSAAVNVSETGGGNNAGGLVGRNTGTITESYATGTVRGAARIGGLVGQNDDGEGAGFVRDSYATADIVDPGPEVGGLVGQNTGLVEQSYAAGTVPDPSFGDKGGLVGNDVVGSGTVINSYWDTEATGQSFTAGGKGLTTDQLKGNTSLNGFDFQSTWDVLTGTDTSYPYLRNNTQTPAPGVEKTVCRQITTPGSYEISSNVTSASTCIRVTTSNVVIDGNGNKIEANSVASGDSEYGIRVSASNVTVRNVTVDGWGETVTTASNDEEAPLTEREEAVLEDGTVTPQNVDEPDSAGILYEDTNDGTVRNVKATNNYHGVHLESTTGTEVADSTATDNRRGIRLFKSNGNNLTNSTANSNDVSGLSVSVDSTNNNLTENEAKGNAYRGVYVYFSDGNSLTKNDVNGNDRIGVGLTLSDDNDLSGNEVNRNGRVGVRLTDSDGNMLSDNTANSNKIGYSFEGSLEGSNNNDGSNNTANGNRRAGVRTDGQSTNNLGLGTSSFSGIFGTAEVEEPEAQKSVGYFEAEGTMTVSVGYDEGEVNESEINVRGHDGDGWSDVNSTVDEGDDVVVAEVDGSHEVYGVFEGDIGVFSNPLVEGFGSAPANTEELDPTLYEDLDGDGDGTDVSETVQVFGELVRGNDLGLSDQQARLLDWSGNSPDEVTVEDMVTLFGKQIRDS